MRVILSLALLAISVSLLAQKSIIRGNVYDGDTGEAVAFATVSIAGTTNGTTTDFDGYYNFTNLEAGTYEIVSSFVGYDTARTTIVVDGTAGDIKYARLTIIEGVSLGVVEVKAATTQARTDVQVSKITLTPRDIKALPSTGGDADIAQYLPVLPGIVSTGDQGGQIYIRGGAPIQNKILLDGVTIFNPFHSIGFFSVFETEAIRNVEVLTGGFGAEYGGRISAVVDINTKVGNRKKFSGLVGVSPFQGRVLLEGPITKFDESKGGSASYLITAKQGYLDRTSQSLYQYATVDSIDRLPFSYRDLYGKVSTLGVNGSKAEFFLFNFEDEAALNTTVFGWNNFGAGMNFKLVPPSSNLLLDGNISYSNYDSFLETPGEDDRTSSLTNILAKVNFVNFSGPNTIRYGFAFNAVQTDFQFVNGFDQAFRLRLDNTEIGLYGAYKRTWDKFVIDPSIRIQYYASQSEFRFEPRLGMKFNATDRIRLKFAGGLYSQNLLSSVNESDIVNLFVGFIGGPEETVLGIDGQPLPDRLQKSVHAVGGVEFDLAPGVLLNVEPYYKDFTQLIAINRNRRTSTEPDYVSETGSAIGIDLSVAYDRGPLYVWTTYSLGRVRRDDGEQIFPTIFDRRHNANVLVSYQLDKAETWEFGFRYNFGTGFPFTSTRGFYAREDFDDGINTDITETNPDLGILLSSTRNGFRLPNFHRADVSLKKIIEFKGDTKLEINASVTNVANRDNIFFISREDNARTDQLPILPSLGATFSW